MPPPFGDQLDELASLPSRDRQLLPLHEQRIFLLPWHRAAPVLRIVRHAAHASR